ncbi:MAG: hypothetical protein PHS59_12140 [Paludibacter sp.]|nr:hypothetical protein [Paludibacter sp.]
MDAYELDETIKEFESEVGKLKSVNDMYAKIENTNKQIIYNADLYKKNNEEIFSIKKQLESTLLNYRDFQGKLMDFNNTLKENLEKEIEALRAENAQLNKNIIENIEKLDASYNKKFFDVRKENRESYQELEKLLSSKLERIKSDIEVSIRDGNVNIERVIGTQFDMKFIQFNELISKKFEQTEKKLSRLFMFSGGILVLVLIDIIINFVK